MTLTQEEFDNKYCQYVDDAIKAARTHTPIPKHPPGKLKATPTWRSERGSRGGLTPKAKRFQRLAKKNLQLAMELLGEVETELGFNSIRGDWQHRLDNSFQIFIACGNSANTQDTKLLDFSNMLRFFGWYNLDFLCCHAAIGLVQDLAWEVGCKFTFLMKGYCCVNACQYLTTFHPSC
jgi:hypothetical protein